MKRYAFIDVQNTETTTRKLLGFDVDWRKLYLYLENKWKCEKVFLYTGIDNENTDQIREFSNLLELGCVVRSKTIFSYKKPEKDVIIKCLKCGEINHQLVDMGYNKKSNCDVDLTVDAMELSDKDTEFLIFTGDGDFEYLIRKIIEIGTKVYLVSSDSVLVSNGKGVKRLSTRLKNLLKEKQGQIDFINLDSWKMKIKK